MMTKANDYNGEHVVCFNVKTHLYRRETQQQKVRFRLRTSVP